MKKDHKVIYFFLGLIVKGVEKCIDFVVDGSRIYEDACKRLRKRHGRH